MNDGPRAITDGHWQRISRALSDYRSLSGRRTRALIFLCRGTGLRISEALSLNTDQILVFDRTTTNRKYEIRSACFLRKEQGKGKRKGKRFAIPSKAKSAIRTYLNAAFDDRAINWPPPNNAPIFITTKRTGKSDLYKRLSKRQAQEDFKRIQRAAGIVPPYRFHDLRHTFATACARASNGDVYAVADAARLERLDTTLRYVHRDFSRVEKLVEAAAADI